MNTAHDPHTDRAVTGFVDRIRALLDDLDEEARTDLVEGLEADLRDLVAERGAEALPEPERYADELRVSAGLPARRGTALLRDRVRRHQQRPGQPPAQRFDAFCDRWRDRFLARATQPHIAPAWSLARAVRPAWWVLRGYLLVQAADVLTGHWESLDLLPQLGVWMLGPLLTLVAILLSVEVGRGRLWPGVGGSGRVPARAALLALNVGALVAAVPVVDAADRLGPELIAVRDASGYVDQSGLRLRGARVCNIQPYDSDGRPLEGVQLFDQDGERITTSCSRWDEGSGRAQHYPWASLGEDRWNVFPQPERTGDRRVKEDAWTSEEPPELPEPDVLRVPPVELPAPPAAESTETPRKQGSGKAGTTGDRRADDPTRPGENRRGDGGSGPR